LTISCSAQHDLLRIAGARRIAIPPVEVIRYGSGFLPRRLPSNGANQNGLEWLPARYVLCVSTLELRKNHRLLLAVWRRMISRHGADAVPTLVLVGRAGYFMLDSSSLLAKLAACGYLGGKIVLMSDLSDRVLVEAYRRCLFTVYPSLYEGWGLPVAESMAHGKFCVASNGGAIPEVGGELVDYFDAAIEDDALAKIERPLLDPNYLAEKESQIQARYRPATWSDCAHELVAKVGYLSNPCSRPLRANRPAESGSRL
jgi:glycosyltransferase involved in cell wall biosynthesis